MRCSAALALGGGREFGLVDRQRVRDVGVEAEMREGRDMLKQMAERTKTYIKKSERRLANLKNLNEAQEEYVKDRYGMDISAFR